MWLIIFIIVITIILAEIGGYFWHRLGAHTSTIPIVRETHKIHHQHDLEGHEADEDFFWVFLLTMAFSILLCIFVIFGLPMIIAVTVFTSAMVVFIWNWYVHAAYHTPGHWLENFDWFIKDRELHFQHHYDPTSNFAIASHFPDMLFGTFSEVDEHKQITFQNKMGIKNNYVNLKSS